MKRMLKIFAVNIILIMTLTACGGNDNASQSGDSGNQAVAEEKGGQNAADADNSGQNATEPSGEESNSLWVTRTVEPPSFGEITYKDHEITSNVSVKIATTPFDYDFDEIGKKLRANSFITDHYKLRTALRENIEQAETYQEGDFHDYTFMKSIDGESKDNQGGREIYADFDFSLSTDYVYYDNTNAVSVSFKDISLEENGVQESIYSVLRDTLGEEVAEYLVYAEAEDGDDMDFDEYVTIEGDTYYFKREVNENTDGKWRISFYMRAYGNQNGFKYVDQGKIPMLQDAKYNLNVLTEGNVSGWNINEFSSDMPEYTSIDMGTEFVRNYLENAIYSEAVSDDNISTYRLIGCEYEQRLYDVSAYMCPSIDVSYEISEYDDEITYLNVIFDGYSGSHLDSSDKEAFHERVFSIVKEQITLLCPCLDPELISYDNFQEKNTWSTTIPVTYLGKECECRIDIELLNQVAEWKVEFNYR